jgi:hypothetical protein
MERRTGLTAEDVWAMFAETDKLQKEGDKRMQAWREESARRDEERQEKWDKGIQEVRDIQKKNALLIKELSRNIGGVSNSNGSVAEEYFFNSLEKKKEFAGIHFDDIEANCTRRYQLKTSSDKKEQPKTVEFDIIMLNSSSVAIIEVKYKAESDDVKDLVENKVDGFRNSYPEYKDFAIYLGLASFSFDDYTISEAKKLGIGLLKQVGETMEYENMEVRAY